MNYTNRLIRPAIAFVLAFVWLLTVRSLSATEQRLRVMIETDAGGDPDDEQSLVRFLLYVNEWDVEGIICNRAETRRPENNAKDDTGHAIVTRMVRAYGECYPKLVTHDARYPKPEALLAKTVVGYDDRDDGVKLILATLDRDDPRPIWYSDWGSDFGASQLNLKRALDRILKERGAAGYAAAKKKLRFLCNANPIGEHLTNADAPIPLVVNTFQPAEGQLRWYHRFSAITAKAGGFDLKRDVLTGHGPLGPLYPENTTHVQKEGDTMTFLYLVPTGMNDPNEPTWGSWAGRYGINEKGPCRNYYWANLADTWQGKTHRENTLRRWAVDLQNDFRTRMDWCVNERAKANHPPKVVMNNDATTNVLRIDAKPGEKVTFDAAKTSDPDNDEMTFEWFLYREPQTYRGNARLDIVEKTRATMTVPDDAAGKSIHVMLTVRDDDAVPLARYRRVVVNVGEK